MLGILITILLASHLLAMNVAAGGPLLCIWLHRRRAPAWSRQAAVALAWSSLHMLMAGIVIGLVLGGVAWGLGRRDYTETLAVFRSKVLWGIAELGCSLLWGWGYWAWLRYRPPQSALARFMNAGLAVLTATNLLYHFPPLMTLMSQVAGGQLQIAEHVDSAAYRKLVFTAPVMSQALHIWIASLAVTGVYLFRVAQRLEDPHDANQTGARLALAATLAQVGSGVWLLVAIPRDQQSQLLGGDSWSTLLLLASMIGTFFLLQLLAALAFGDKSKDLPGRIALVLAGIVLCMTAVLLRIV